jgi:hypothetical protein
MGTSPPSLSFLVTLYLLTFTAVSKDNRIALFTTTPHKIETCSPPHASTPFLDCLPCEVRHMILKLVLIQPALSHIYADPNGTYAERGYYIAEPFRFKQERRLRSGTRRRAGGGAIPSWQSTPLLAIAFTCSELRAEAAPI